MNFTPREQRAIALAQQLTAKMNACQASGVDPYEHPRVREILREMADNMPDAAKPLQDRQERIQVELLGLVEQWQPGPQAFGAMLAMIQRVDEKGAAAIPTITQDVDAQRLLREYTEIDEQIIDMLAKED